MSRTNAGVKRPYDATRRRERAQRTRSEVLDAARRMLLDQGYAATTVPRVAQAAGVSAETVYKAFRNKPGLVRAVVEHALRGTGSIPAETRSDALQAQDEQDARAVLHGWGRLSAEVAPQVAPLLLLVRAGAGHDAELAALHAELEAGRRRRMRDNAGRLVGKGQLRSDLSAAAVADVLWTYTAPELYELVVERCGWSARRYGDFVAEGLAAHLLPPPPEN